MTTPYERTRASSQAGELLRDLQKRQDLPTDVRQRVAGVLRHYPEEWQLRMMAQDWQRLADASFGLVEAERADQAGGSQNA